MMLSSSQTLLLPGVMVTAVMEAWEVTAATERIREADRGSNLISPPLFSCRDSRNHGKKNEENDYVKKEFQVTL